MKKFLTLLSFLACFSFANAIKCTFNGDLSVLKGEKAVNIKYTYNDMIVGSMSEEAYLEKKVSEYNAKKPGRGDEFKKSWERNKQSVYPVSFNQLFEKSCGIKANTISDEKYTLIVNTNYFEPGFNVGVVRRNAEISVVIKLVKTDEPDKTIAEIVITNSPGRTVSGYDYDVASRVSESYAKAGKECGKIIKKNNK